MIIVLIGLVAGVALLSLLEDRSSRIFNEYCGLECTEKKPKDYSVCC